MLADLHGEFHRPHLVGVRLPLGHDPPVLAVGLRPLDQNAAVDAPDLALHDRLREPEHPHVLLGLHDRKRFRGVRRGDHDLDERPDELPGDIRRHLTVQGDDGAVGRDRVDLTGGDVGRKEFPARRHAAGVVVLDDDCGAVVELPEQADRGMDVEVVVVGHRLSLERLLRGDAGISVDRRRLVRVLAVPERPPVPELEGEGFRERPVDTGQVVRDCAVVCRRPGERLCSKSLSLFSRETASPDGVRRHPVVGAVHHDRDVLMVLCRRPHHRGTADIDVLDRLIKRESPAAHRLEGVEVHHHKVDGFDAVLLHNGVVDTPAPEDAPVDLRVEGLYPPVHHLRRTGVGGDFGKRNPRLRERRPGAAGTQETIIMLDEHLCKIDDAGFIPDRQQCPLHGYM